MRIKILTIFIVSIAIIMFTSVMSCDTQSTLGSVPVASFEMIALTPKAGSPYNVMLINTTYHSIAYWNIPGVGRFKNLDTVRCAFAFSGEYPVSLIVTGAGGLDSITKNIQVTSDNPFATDSTSVLGFLTGAYKGGTPPQKTWYLDTTTAFAVVVAESAAVSINAILGKGAGWWGYQSPDRKGSLDDTYTFVFDRAGTFKYDDRNTFFSDATYQLASQNQDNVISPSGYGTTQKTWASGTFTYSAVPAPAGAMQLGKIIVSGLGAHIGFAGKENGGEVAVPTATSITYDILYFETKTNTRGKYDFMIIGVSYNSQNNYWSFALRSQYY